MAVATFDTREVRPSRNLELTSNWDHQRDGREGRTLTLFFFAPTKSLLTHSGGMGSIRVSGKGGGGEESKNILLNFERSERGVAYQPHIVAAIITNSPLISWREKVPTVCPACENHGLELLTYCVSCLRDPRISKVILDNIWSKIIFFKVFKEEHKED